MLGTWSCVLRQIWPPVLASLKCENGILHLLGRQVGVVMVGTMQAKDRCQGILQYQVIIHSIVPPLIFLRTKQVLHTVH